MPRIVVLDQLLKSWLFRFLTTKIDVIFISQKPNRFLFQFRFERAIACFCWRSYTLLPDSAGSNTPQAAPNSQIEYFRVFILEQIFSIDHNFGLSMTYEV